MIKRTLALPFLLLIALFSAGALAAEEITFESDAPALKPFLIAAKTIKSFDAEETGLFVVNRPMTVQYDFYNAGDAPAFDVRLSDYSFLPEPETEDEPKEEFKLVSGSHTSVIKEIPAGEKGTITYTIRPLIKGTRVDKPADFSYRPTAGSNAIINAQSSQAGQFEIIPESKYEVEHASHTGGWMASLVVAALLTVGPYMYFRNTLSIVSKRATAPK